MKQSKSWTVSSKTREEIKKDKTDKDCQASEAADTYGFQQKNP